MNSNNASIKAIIFTMTLFLFIILISLFKGIYLSNIRIGNTEIKSIFIKIDNKIILRLNDVNITNYNNKTASKANLKKTIYLSLKILNFFQKIEINSLRYNNILISKIIYNNAHLKILSDTVKTEAVINTRQVKPYINFKYIEFPENKMTINNTVINMSFCKSLFTASGSGSFQKNKFFFKMIINSKDRLKLTLSSPKIIYNDKIKALFKKTDIQLKADINSGDYTIKGLLPSALVTFQGKTARITQTSFVFKQGNLYINTKKIHIPEYSGIKNIFLINAKIYYDTKHNFLTVASPIINLKYKTYKIKSTGNKLVYINSGNINFKNSRINIRNKTTAVTLKACFLNIFNKHISYEIQKVYANMKNITLYSDKITGDTKKLHTDSIKGKIYGFNTNINKVDFDIADKLLNIKKILFNGIEFENIKYKNNKIEFATKTIFNNKLKEVILKFTDKNIPVLQTKGNNYIHTEIYLKNNTFASDILLNNALFNIYGYNLFLKSAKINADSKKLDFNISDAKINLKNIFAGYSGKGVMDFEKKLFETDGKINLKIDGFINLKNFKEHITYNLAKNIIKTKNTFIYADFNKRYIIITTLKKLITLTPLKDFITDSLIMLTFDKNIHIYSTILLKIPFFIKHSNFPIKTDKKTPVKKLFIYIKIKNGLINIHNKHINAEINSSAITAKINNIDMDLTPLEKLLNKNSKKENNTTKENNNTEQNSSFAYTVRLDTNNSNIIYKTHKFLSQKAVLNYKKGNFSFNSYHKKSSIHGYTKHGYFLLEGKNFSNEEFKAFLPNFSFFSLIDTDFVLIKSPDDFYTGKIYINHAVIEKMKTLNNIIAFINTIPSILSFSSLNFSSKGFKIKKGYINYLLYKKILYIKDAKIIGRTMDLFAKGYVDFNKNYIFIKVQANIKMKIKDIPIVGKGVSYLLFGKDGSIDIKMVVKGNLSNPKVEKDLGKEILMTPFNLFKRAVTLPFNLF